MATPLSARDIMTRDVVCVDVAQRVDAAQELRERTGVHYLAVQDDGELVGVVCACDLAKAFPNRSVQSACRRPPVFVSSDCDLNRTAEVMESCGVGSVLVLDDGVLRGIVTAADLIAHGVWDREAWRCASCGAHHELRNENGPPRFCAECLEQSRSDGYRKYYFTLGGGD